MVPILSRRLGGFSVAATANAAAPTPQGPMVFRPGGGIAALNPYGLTPEPFPGSRANHDCTRRRWVSAAPAFGQRLGLRRGDCR
jgi:hypothetical protein